MPANMKAQRSIDYAKTSRHRNIGEAFQLEATFGVPILYSARQTKLMQIERLVPTNDGGSAVLIILCLYIVALWVLFGKFKLVR